MRLRGKDQQLTFPVFDEHIRQVQIQRTRIGIIDSLAILTTLIGTQFVVDAALGLALFYGVMGSLEGTVPKEKEIYIYCGIIPIFLAGFIAANAAEGARQRLTNRTRRQKNLLSLF